MMTYLLVAQTDMSSGNPVRIAPTPLDLQTKTDDAPARFVTDIFEDPGTKKHITIITFVLGPLDQFTTSRI